MENKICILGDVPLAQSSSGTSRRLCLPLQMHWCVHADRVMHFGVLMPNSEPAALKNSATIFIWAKTSVNSGWKSPAQRKSSWTAPLRDVCCWASECSLPSCHAYTRKITHTVHFWESPTNRFLSYSILPLHDKFALVINTALSGHQPNKPRSSCRGKQLSCPPRLK